MSASSNDGELRIFQVLHVGGQIDILRFWLEEFPPKNSERTRESIVIMMHKIIRKHQRIIQFSTCIENLYTYITLVLFSVNTMMICMLAFLVVIVSIVSSIIDKG